MVDRRTGPSLRSFTYLVPAEMEGDVVEGARVVVPFGKQSVTGYVLGLSDSSDFPDPRPIEALAGDEPSLLLPYQVALAHWISDYYAAPLPEVVRAMIPPGIRSIKVGSKRPRGPRVTSRDRSLSAEARVSRTRQFTAPQDEAAEAVREALRKGWGRLLLHGVTGSGKTEVYLQAIEDCLALGRGVIVLVPEVSLTPQTISRFAERFAGRVAVLHSLLTPSEKALEWRRLRSGEARVAIGPRAAIFAPVPDLGLVVVDEEHSSTYKQLRVPRYHAVDVAHRLGDLARCVVLLGSATPSLTSYYAHGRGVDGFEGARVLELPGRYSGEPLPEMEVADMRQDDSWNFSRPVGTRLAEAARQELEGGGQVILYLNRRGLAWYARCRKCGEAVGCPNCSVSLVYHGVTRELSCHYCGHTEPMPQRCPNCEARDLSTVGFGTERIEAEARRLFPAARVTRLDRDTAATRDSFYGIWESLSRGDVDVLVGTSLVAKGWDLPKVGLVGVVDADQALNYPDYRAAEDTFASLVQVAGRARRSDARAIVQTMNPHHYAVRLALQHDYHEFFAEELAVREALDFPPFTRLIDVTTSAVDDAQARRMAESYAGALRDSLVMKSIEGVSVFGPSQAFIHRLRGEYRWSLTIKGPELGAVKPLLPDGRGFTVDVDPL
ncbi:MAG: primosomal protein N' [Candidatus Dormibacteraeota bacterium]|nr:primosomal protein N' [Candidatus Dormibacteraeota bacterium]